jgi:hypothetical protein
MIITRILCMDLLKEMMKLSCYKYRALLLLISTFLYAQQAANELLVIPKKKRSSQRIIKEEIACGWEEFLNGTIDCVATIAGIQKRLVAQREALERFISKAGENALNEHGTRLDLLNKHIVSFQTTLAKEFKQLEADIEKFCIT